MAESRPFAMLSEKSVSWFLAVGLFITTLFIGWMAKTVHDVELSIVGLSAQIKASGESRGEAVAIVVEQIKNLGSRVDRLEDTMRERGRSR